MAQLLILASTALLSLLATPAAAALGTTVELFKSPGCTGTSLSVPVGHAESNCRYCIDTCGEKFSDGADAHGTSKSIMVPAGYIALTYSTCSGSFGYSDPGFQGVLKEGCQEINNKGNVYQHAHFVFATESATTPGTYELAGVAPKTAGPFSSQLTTGHWSFGPGGSSNADGTSWYTYIFDLLEPTQQRMRFQVGTGGTWLKPQLPTWTKGVDACRCDPGRWPATEGGQSCQAADKRTCTNGCCGTNGCTGLYQTMEGGTGYWNNQLPTSAPKWRINAVTGCYKTETASPLWSFYGNKLTCDNLGVIPVSNRLLIAPDGIAFQSEGMLGQAWVDTPLGWTSDADASSGRRFWSLVLDTANFKGPVGYLLPEYWSSTTHSKWQDSTSGSFHPSSDFGNSGMNTGGGAFEWHTIPVVGSQGATASDRTIRIPQMRMGLNDEQQTAATTTTTEKKKKRTVLMTGFKSWKNTPASLRDPLEAVLSGSATSSPANADWEAALMPATAGTTHSCPGSKNEKLKLSFEGKQLDFGGTIVTAQEGAACVAAVNWAESNANADCSSGTHCSFKTAYQVTEETIVKDQAAGTLTVVPGELKPLSAEPSALQAAGSFPGAGSKTYDRKDPASQLCGAVAAVPAASSSAAAAAASANTLWCRQSKAGDWMGWRWYKFTEQPGFQRLNLPSDKKAFVQARVERLHRATAPKAPLNEWLKAPTDGSLPPLVEVDVSSIVAPPCGLEYGYVPVVVYQAMTKPAGCVQVVAAGTAAADGSDCNNASTPAPAPPPSGNTVAVASTLGSGCGWAGTLVVAMVVVAVAQSRLFFV